jgi:outer membrane lipoprotein-sorting protein
MRRIAVAFIVLPLALAACGGNEARVLREQLTPRASVQQAANKTAAATSAHLTFNGSGTLEGERQSLTGTADFDIANGRGSFHAEVPEYGAVDLVLDRNTAYLRAPFLKVLLPAGKTWLKLDGKMRRSLPNSVPQDPKQALGRLKKLADVRKVGEEEIDGVTTTHYHGVARRGEGTFDVWVGNDDGYVRRVSAKASGQGADGDVVITLSDFGEPVTVTPPPASETADASALGALFKAKGFRRA